MTVLVVRRDRALTLRGLRRVIYPFEIDITDVWRREGDVDDGGTEQPVALILLGHSQDCTPRVTEFDASGGDFPLLRADLPVAGDHDWAVCALLRQAADRSWRARAIRAIANVLPLDHPASARLVALLREGGPLHACALHSVPLSEPIMRRSARAERLSSGVRWMRAKEAQDWAYCLRLAAGHPFGITMQQLAGELGLSLRTVKRIRVRMADVLPSVRTWTPELVIEALLRRITPPARDIGGKDFRQFHPV